MELFQLVLAILAVVTPVAGGVGFAMKRYSDGKYLELESRLKTAETKATVELEAVRADTAQQLSASESIKSLTGTLVAMVEERRESTAAVKENTAALQTMSGAIDGLSKDRGDALSTLTTAMTTLTTLLSESLSALVKSQGETTQAVLAVATGQDELEDLYKALALALEMVFNKLKSDNRKFAEYMLRPDESSKQGIEDIAADKPAPPAVTTAVTIG